MSESIQPRRAVDAELIDEFDATMAMLGRLIGARHGQPCEGELSPQQLLTLRILADSGPRKSGELAGYLGIKAPATTALVDGLVREGLAEREHDESDRRITLVRTTDEGRARLRKAELERREHMRNYLSVLSDEDIRTLLRIQRTLIEAMLGNQL